MHLQTVDKDYFTSIWATTLSMIECELCQTQKTQFDVLCALRVNAADVVLTKSCVSLSPWHVLFVLSRRDLSSVKKQELFED